MVRLAHLADVRIPRWPTKAWREHWTEMAKEVVLLKPDLILITGDLLTWSKPIKLAKQRLAWFVKEFAPQTLQTQAIYFAPGSRDLQVDSSGAMSDTLHQPVTQRDTLLRAGWLDNSANIHINVVSVGDAKRLLHKDATDLSRIAIPLDCTSRQHLHIFALHPDPYARQAGDPSLLLAKLEECGYDIVLTAQRSARDHAMPVAERRLNGLWLIGAPRATGKVWQGFNLIDVETFESFKISTVTRFDWKHPYLIASRDYEEARTRHWREQRAHRLTCAVVDVTIANYADGNDIEQEVQRRCGDVLVTIVLRQPRQLQPPAQEQYLRVPLPLASVAGYKGSSWRALSASLVDGTPLMINDDDGTIRVPANNDRDIEITGVLLNALPTKPGDWKRMQSSHSGEKIDPFVFALSMPARFLRVRIECPQLRHLPFTAHGASVELTDEEPFLATRSDKGGQAILVYRPIIGITYALGDSLDPLKATGEPKQPGRIIAWQKTIAALRASGGRESTLAPDVLRLEITKALDVLRHTVLVLAKHLQPTMHEHDDITVDLLSIHRGLEVVVTDSYTAKHKPPRRNPMGIGFSWGQGVAGRALRLTKEYSWSYTEITGHETTLPADNWYHHHENISVHAHVYCRPVLSYDASQPYAIAMLSFATHTLDSGLADIIRQLDDRTDTLDVRRLLNDAVRDFETALDQALKHHYREHGAGDDDAATDY